MSTQKGGDAMKTWRWIALAAIAALVVLPATAALAQMGYGWGNGYGMGWGRGPGMMGPGWGPGTGPGWAGAPCAGGYGGSASPDTTAVDEATARQLAQDYADKYLKGYTVELKGPENEIRTLHINPWGEVMPFGGPRRRG
jgi:hypothetical protein